MLSVLLFKIFITSTVSYENKILILMLCLPTDIRNIKTTNGTDNTKERGRKQRTDGARCKKVVEKKRRKKSEKLCL